MSASAPSTVAMRAALESADPTTLSETSARGGKEQSPDQVDLAIIGAGPTGLYAAYYAGFRGLRTAVLDAPPEAGGQLAALYPEKPIYDVAGFAALRGRELVERLLEQAAAFTPAYLLGDQVVSVEGSAGAFRLRTATGTSLRSSAVLVAGGIGTFAPRPLPAAAQFPGGGVSYFVPRLDEYDGKDVLIVGGGDSAFDWASALEPLANSVTLVHRRDRFRAHAATVASVVESTVNVLPWCEVSSLEGDPNVAAAHLVNVRTGESFRMKAQAVVASLGFLADIGPVANWDLALRGRPISVDTTMSTSRSGVFAAGDISQYPGKVRLISVGFGEAALAVNNAATLINPGASLAPGHSSDARSSASRSERPRHTARGPGGEPGVAVGALRKSATRSKVASSPRVYGLMLRRGGSLQS